MPSLARRFLGGVAIGLLALLGWKAYSRSQAAGPPASLARWVCPMRCLNKTYGLPGTCPVCHMKLVPAGGPQARHVSVSTWPTVGDKMAIYFRPYEVRKVQVDRLLRVAGSVSKDGRHLTARLPLGAEAPLKGATAMIMPAVGYARPALGSVERTLKDGRLLIKVPNAIAGFAQVSAEIRLPGPSVVAVPQEAIDETGTAPRVFARRGSGAEEAFVPLPVNLGQRGERFVEVLEGLHEGDVIAGSGLFWLEAQWRMDHPEADL